MSIQAPASARPAVATGVVSASKAGYYRWYVCALLFFASVINYIDRQVIGILKPTLQQQFGWSELDYGDIVFSFQLAYAIGFIFAGRLMDRVGTRNGFAIAVVVWSVAAMAHARVLSFGARRWRAMLGAVRLTYSASVAGFMAARFALGSARRRISRRHQDGRRVVSPQGTRVRDRHLQRRHNVGALLTPLIVPWSSR